MTCTYCRSHMCARTYAQLENRSARLVDPCPLCGNTDWALSVECIPKDEPEFAAADTRAWQRFKSWWKTNVG
jgi:hypothetical protein